MKIRDQIKQLQEEVRGDLTTTRAAEILNELSALLGNVNENLKDARESIGLLSCQMETCMTDGSKGDKYQAVSMNVVNTWFDILDKRINEALQDGGKGEK